MHWRIGNAIAILIGWVSSTDASASVIVVDVGSGPGSQFNEIQDALNAAAEGDVILVRPGQYFESVTIPDKSLTIQSDGGGVEIFPQTCDVPVQFLGLSTGKRVVLRGFTFHKALCFGMSPKPALSAVGSAGTIWIDECIGGPYSVMNCAELVVTNSAIGGGTGTSASLNVTSSNLFLHGTKVGGANGLDGAAATPQPTGGHPGGSALALQGASSALISNSELTGGQGGDGYFFFFCLDAGVGGPAIKLGSGDPIVRVMSSTVSSGPSGLEFAGCSPTPQGPAVAVQSGSYVETPGVPKTLWVESPVREADSIIIQMSDVSGSSALFLFSATHASVSMPQYGGALHLGLPLFLAPLGTVPSHGTLTLTVPVPDLPAGLQGLVVFTQGATCPPASPCSLTAPEPIVILDSSF